MATVQDILAKKGSDIISVAPGETVLRAAQLMNDRAIGGLVVTEQVFNLNGIGKLFALAVSRGDYTLIQALVLLVAVVFVMVNFVIDLLYAVFDPRIRYR